MPMVAEIMIKNYITLTSGNVFQLNLCHYQHISYDFYQDNYKEKSFPKLTPFVNVFQHSLHHYQHISYHFDQGYADNNIIN
jgi:hypothetical protein